MHYRIPKRIRAAVDQSEPVYSPPPSGSPNGGQKPSPGHGDPMQHQGWQMQSPQHLANNGSPPQGMSVGNNGMMGLHPLSPQQVNNMMSNNMPPSPSPSNSPTYNQNMVPPGQLPPCSGESLPQTTCLRNGCSNLAIDSLDWDREYCSSECVVSHCKDVFANWVAQRQVSTNSFMVK